MANPDCYFVMMFSLGLVPGDKFVIETEVLSWKRGICKGRGVGYTNGEVACSADMTITIPEVLKQYLPEAGES